MNPTEKYEIIGNYIYSYARVEAKLAGLLMALDKASSTEWHEGGLENLIRRIRSELSNRESNIGQKFSEIADEIYTLEKERDAHTEPRHIPDGAKTKIFLDRCATTITKLTELEQLLAP